MRRASQRSQKLHVQLEARPSASASLSPTRTPARAAPRWSPSRTARVPQRALLRPPRPAPRRAQSPAGLPPRPPAVRAARRAKHALAQSAMLRPLLNPLPRRRHLPPPRGQRVTQGPPLLRVSRKPLTQRRRRPQRRRPRRRRRQRRRRQRRPSATRARAGRRCRRRRLSCWCGLRVCALACACRGSLAETGSRERAPCPVGRLLALVNLSPQRQGRGAMCQPCRWMYCSKVSTGELSPRLPRCICIAWVD